MSDYQHRSWLEFVRRAMDLPIEYSPADLERFRAIAQTQYPALLKVIEAYINLIKQSSLNSVKSTPRPAQKQASIDNDGNGKILDLLRDSRIFPKNRDIANFAQKILPNMRTYRFDKMSKSDVALRIVQYLETLNSATRQQLEASMRDALNVPPEQGSNRRSFLSKWESIIKGIELG